MAPEVKDREPGHVISRCIPTCPHCGADASCFYVKDYDLVWQDGQVMCGKCDKKVRDYDAG